MLILRLYICRLNDAASMQDEHLSQQLNAQYGLTLTFIRDLPDPIYKINHKLPPTMATITKIVRMPAPALSLVVIGLRFAAGSGSALEPALGSLFDVPPVVAVSGAILSVIRVEPMTLSACI